MRRLLLPVLLLIIVIATSIQMNNANEAADPGLASATSDSPSLETPIFSARRAPDWLRSPKSDSLLTDAIGTVLTTGEQPALACVLVTRGDEQLAASSTQTAIRAAELHRFGRSVRESHLVDGRPSKVPGVVAEKPGASLAFFFDSCG